MALLTISTQMFQNDQMMNVIDRFADHLDAIAYGYDTVILRVINDEVPQNDVKIEIFVASWFTNIEPFVIGWKSLPN